MINAMITLAILQFHILYVNKMQKEQIRDTRVPSQGVTVVLTTLWYEKKFPLTSVIPKVEICNL